MIDDLRAELDPPAGRRCRVWRARVVAAAAGEDDLAASMWLVTLLALLAVALLVAVLSRSIEAAAGGRDSPIALATGWSCCVLFVLPIDVDFLTAALGAIVVAICAGPRCSAARGYRDARAAGLAPEVAVEQLRERRAPRVAFGAVTRRRLRRAHGQRHPDAARSRRGGSGEPAAVRARRDGLAAGDARVGGAAGRPASAAHARGARGGGALACTLGRSRRPRARPARSATPRARSVVVSPRRAARRGPWWRRADEAAVSERPDPFTDEDREREAEEARRAARPYSIAVGVVFLGVILFAGINAVRNSGEAVLGPEKGTADPAVRRAHRDREARRRREHRSGRGRERQAPWLGLPGRRGHDATC